MSKIVPNLWFTTDAEEAAGFYVSLVPGSRIVNITRWPEGNGMAPAGSVLTVELELAGQRFTALNGGENPNAGYTDAVSLLIDCEDQQEVDRIYDAILANGGEAQQCGWIKDRWGLRWQVIPEALPRLMQDEDQEAVARVVQAMLQMKKIDVAELEKAYAG